MIVVEANLISAMSAMDGHQETLCVVHISNDGTGSETRGNYNVRLYSRGLNQRLIRSARVENWPRNAKPAWRLIQAAMAALE